MFYHVYTDRCELSVDEAVAVAETQNGYHYENMKRVHVLVSELIKSPALIKDVLDLLLHGEKENKLVVLQNDVDQQSIKHSLEGKVPAMYRTILKYLNQAVKKKTVAV
ncbi:hypothetical protein JOD82_001810 [Paenibacillus sp. 1182]|uniref:hypothetical protein n=1 Tax=Paenibacillus sp. 1182 TaxID=2806565 RepID=UPI001AE322B2|nr:hypothetical protein [Paenibacillus sp. 1182]MBP1308790.1 hypothetical protein [Paenibacillus sp. 1182]